MSNLLNEPASEPVDRGTLITLLEGLDSPSFDMVVNHLPGATRNDVPRQSIFQRAIALVDFVEGTVGPGLSALAQALVDVVPGLNIHSASGRNNQEESDIDRSTLLKLLQDLDDTSFGRVLMRILGATRNDAPQQPVPQRAARLVDFVEGAVGPGLSVLAQALVDVVPNFASELGLPTPATETASANGGTRADTGGTSGFSSPKNSILQPNNGKLNLRGAGLSVLPEELKGRQDVTELVLIDNPSLTTLPDWIESLANLELLDLAGNNLAELPRQITRLPRLSSLILTGNSALPDYLRPSDGLNTRAAVRSALLRYHRERYQGNLQGLNVCVIGQGGKDLSGAQMRATQLVGRMLADAGAHLIVGNYSGVDQVAARAYLERAEELDKTDAATRTLTVLETATTRVIRNKLVAELTQRSSPALTDVNVITRAVREDTREGVWSDWFTGVEVVLLIGGGHGGKTDAAAYARFAAERGLLVLPLAWTGRGALMLFNELFASTSSEDTSNRTPLPVTGEEGQNLK